MGPLFDIPNGEGIVSDIDISILRRCPKLDDRVEVTIQPLAPLSMVSELPGSYYRTLKAPDEKMLCGLFENILGWHIDLANRKVIFKEIQKVRDNTCKPIDYTKGSTFLPLLMDFFKVQSVSPNVTRVMFYDDLWKRAYQRTDELVHLRGANNISIELMKKEGELKRGDKNPQQVEESLKRFFKENFGVFPLYYSIPTIREYVSIEGKYVIKAFMDKKLSEMLRKRIKTDNIGYLGNSEGWVDVSIVKI
jgi:CRISPR-associated protein Cas5